MDEVSGAGYARVDPLVARKLEELPPGSVRPLEEGESRVLPRGVVVTGPASVRELLQSLARALQVPEEELRRDLEEGRY